MSIQFLSVLFAVVFAVTLLTGLPLAFATGAVAVVFSVVLFGLPGLSPFVAEMLVLIAAFQHHWWTGAIVVTAIVLAAFYVLWMYQRVLTGPSLAVSRASLAADQSLEYILPAGRHAWLQVLAGDVTVAGNQLHAGDGLAVSDETAVAIRATADADLLLFDLG